MPRNLYTMTGEDLASAYAEACRADFAAMERRRELDSWRAPLRRLVAYLAIRWGAQWLDARAEVLEGYLPRNWQYLAHHELVTYLDVQGITAEHCTLT